MFEKIVVAIDGSEASEHALEIACDLAGKYNSELHLVHSPQLETTAIAVGAGAVVVPADPEKIEEAGHAVLDKSVEIVKAKGCKLATPVMKTGSPAEVILSAIKSSNADLVVMGRRGLGSLSGLVLGSVSQKVSHDANCTCMTVC